LKFPYAIQLDESRNPRYIWQVVEQLQKRKKSFESFAKSDELDAEKVDFRAIVCAGATGI